MKRYRTITTDRDISGILLLDKPMGFSSNFLLKIIKKLFWVNKVGHAGTLDPLATGILPIFFGRATKFAQYFLNYDKRYIVSAQLGVSTDTFDSEGKVIRVSSVIRNSVRLKECLRLFQGSLNQIPPMFSAVKYRGCPLYRYARKGINVPRKSRNICVYSIFLLSSINDVIKLSIHCSKGTYIRSIINDVGECLGCGAHVVSLRRISFGPWESFSMIELKTIENIFYDSAYDDTTVLYKLDSLLITMNTIKSFFM